jgi:hypothetical protein
VREGGIEPPRAFAHKILSLARLPISPLPQRSSHGLVTLAPPQVKMLCERCERVLENRDLRTCPPPPMPKRSSA